MKRDDKKVMSFRFDDPIIKKIDYLMEEDRKNSEKLGLKPSTRKEIIEDAIKDYYLRKINRSRDPDIMDRIIMMVDDAADVRFGMFKRILDEIYFLATKNDLANRILLNSDGVPKAPDFGYSAAGEIVNKRCRWDEELQNYMMDHWTRYVARFRDSSGRTTK